MKHGMSAYPSLGLSIQPKEDLNSNQRVQDKLGAFEYNTYHQLHHHLDHKYQNASFHPQANTTLPTSQSALDFSPPTSTFYQGHYH